MKQLPPLRLKQEYFKEVEAEIKRILDQLLYAPLAALLAGHDKAFYSELQNALGDDPVIDAIRSGKISYDGARFTGEFNARISRRLQELGARYDKRSKSWILQSRLATVGISMAQAEVQMRLASLQASIIKTLDSINIDSIDEISSLPDKYSQTIDWVEGDFQKTVKAITIPPKLTAATKKIIAEQWGENLNLYIKNWTAENILKLREQVQESAFSGQRAKTLAKVIQDNYGVSRRKAEFLARQETSLLVSKFRETRYKDIGANKYIWRGVMDEREREDHKELQGQIFTWDSPPVVDQRTGRRAHPGEDFGCRCVAVAVIE